MNKPIKYGVIAVVLGLAAFNAVNIEPLDQRIQHQIDAVFDAKAYASDFMNHQIEALPAIDAAVFLENLSRDLEGYCEQHGKKLGISDTYNFIIEGNATVQSVEEEYVRVALENEAPLKLATDFIFGNAIRDGSAMAHIDDYQSTMDFNSISVELNQIVRETILPPFKASVKTADRLYFKGAVKIDISGPLDHVNVIPLRIKFKN